MRLNPTDAHFKRASNPAPATSRSHQEKRRKESALQRRRRIGRYDDRRRPPAAAWPHRKPTSLFSADHRGASMRPIEARDRRDAPPIWPASRVVLRQSAEALRLKKPGKLRKSHELTRCNDAGRVIPSASKNLDSLPPRCRWAMRESTRSSMTHCLTSGRSNNGSAASDRVVVA